MESTHSRAKSRLAKFAIHTGHTKSRRHTIQKQYHDAKRAYHKKSRATLKQHLDEEEYYEDNFKLVEQYPENIGDKFVDMNRHWSDDISADEWSIYHSSYKAAREKWDIVPQLELIKELGKTEGLKIADMGCGDGRLELELPFHEVDSYDLHAYADHVNECNIEATGTPPDTYDIVIFSLSLLGNIRKKLREAKRILVSKGTVMIWHIRSARDTLTEIITDEGFRLVERRDESKFIYLELQL